MTGGSITMSISLISILIALGIVCVLIYCAKLLIAAFEIPNPIATVLYVVVIILCLLVMLQAIGGFGSWGVISIR